jgi:hypothetical protein
LKFTANNFYAISTTESFRLVKRVLVNRKK